MRARVAIASWMLFCLAQPVAAASVSLAPLKDNTLIQRTDPAEQLSNGLGDIFVGRTNQDGQGEATISIRRGLISFDIAGSVPAGATITAASLTLRDVMGLNGDPTVQLHRTLADWGEGTSFQNGGMGAAATQGDATWLYRFYDAATPGDSPTWAAPGGDYSEIVSSEAVISDDLGGAQLFTWSSEGFPQLLDDLQSWLDHPTGNFGWTLTGDETRGQSAKRLNSGNSTTPPQVPPQLTIEYVLRPGDTNQDGKVDIQDLNNVRNNFGSVGLGDTNGDNAVDIHDLNAVRNNFGAFGNEPRPVPEPHSVVILLVTTAALWRWFS
jgi:hypothetical protein